MTPYDKFLKTVVDAHYFDQHASVLVALSGGVDSMTLFDWLYQAKDRLNVTLSVAHINHKQRVVSDLEENLLSKKMAELGVPFYAAHYEGTFSEEKARDFRYAFFEEVMIAQHISAIVTAHHSNDVIENFLIRQIRGSRLRFLTGMKPVQRFGPDEGSELIRPLLSFEKSELTATTYFEDVSNAENEYLRNRVRNTYLPAFSKENPRFSENLASLSEEIGLAMTVVSDSMTAFSGAKFIELMAFNEETEALQYFILQDYLTQFPTLEVAKRQFDQLLHIIRRQGQYLHAMSSDYNFVKNQQYFYIEKRGDAIAFETSLTPFVFGEFSQVAIPDTGEIIIRKRLAGDRVVINGMHKKLRRFFIDNKIALKKRDNPLVTVDNQIYGVLDVVSTDLSKSLKHAKIKRTLYYREKR